VIAWGPCLDNAWRDHADQSLNRFRTPEYDSLGGPCLDPYKEPVLLTCSPSLHARRRYSPRLFICRHEALYQTSTSLYMVNSHVHLLTQTHIDLAGKSKRPWLYTISSWEYLHHRSRPHAIPPSWDILPIRHSQDIQVRIRTKLYLLFLFAAHVR
jgi:hypothetical protein